MKTGKLWLLLISFFTGLWFQVAANATGSDIDFTSIISGKFSDGSTSTITVSIYGFDVDVVINDGSSIEIAGETGEFDDLEIGDYVKIEAFFAPEGIVAEEVQVLDSQKEEFRIRGIIQAVTPPVDDIVVVTVLDVDISVGPETRITRRASRNGNSVPATELVVGDIVNIFGQYDDLTLLAERIHVGNRPQGLIELNGVITAIDSDVSITVLVGEATEAVVLIDENTYIGGELAIDAFVEVRGQLDESLNVLGFEILVDEDGDGDADDDNHRHRGQGMNNGNPGDDEDDEDDESGLEIEAEISLTPQSGDLSGKAKIKYEEEGETVQQVLEVRIKDADPNSTYRIEVLFGGGPEDFGTFDTDGDGDAKSRFDTDVDPGEIDLTPLLPAGMDVRNITVVRIYNDVPELVLEGSF